MRTLPLGVLALLASLVGACAEQPDEGVAASEGALTAGQLDPSFAPAFAETFVGEHGARLFFLGRDEVGTYIARRGRALGLDASYGAGGKAHVAGPWTPRETNRHPERDWIAAGAVLPDGRVVITGGREGPGDFVNYGAFMRGASLTLGVVAADGRSKVLEPVAVAPPLPTTGCAVLAHGGTRVLPLADGSLVVGASANCFSNGWKAARLFHFDAVGAGFAFGKLFWEGGSRGGAADLYGEVSVTDLAAGAPGRFLVTSSRRRAWWDGATRDALPTHGYVAASLATAAPTAFDPKPILYAGASGTPSAAARLADGSFVVAGKAERCIGLQRVSPSPDVDLAFGAPAIPVTCVPGSSAEEIVALVAASSGRLLLVTDSSNTVFVPGQPPATTYATRVRSIDGGGALDPTFGAAGIVTIASPSTPEGLRTASPKGAYVAQGYLYVQLGSGSPPLASADPNARVRRIKL